MMEYDRYVDLNWWTKVEKRQIARWLNNFSGGDRRIGKKILDNVIFYNEEQLDTYTEYIINQIKAELYVEHKRGKWSSVETDDYLEKCWETTKKTMKIIPASVHNEVGGSEFEVVRRYRKFVGAEGTIYVAGIETAINKGVTELIFVDDFSGTGTQIKTFLETVISVNGKEIRICDIPLNYPDVNLTVAVYVVHGKGKKLLTDMFPYVKLRYVDCIDESLDFFNKDSVIYQDMELNEVHEMITFMKNKKSEIIRENPSYQDMEQYELNIPIVFCHGCPNNALLLLYAETNSWKRIFKLGETL